MDISTNPIIYIKNEYDESTIHDFLSKYYPLHEWNNSYVTNGGVYLYDTTNIVINMHRGIKRKITEL